MEYKLNFGAAIFFPYIYIYFMHIKFQSPLYCNGKKDKKKRKKDFD